MSYFPVFVDLRGRRCVVVGGGVVAERKVRGLREAEASLTVVAPSVTAALRAQAASGEILHVAREYRPGDLAGASLAMVAVGDPAVSHAVREEARVRGLWLNAADEPEHCDFILPAILRRGPLVVAVATGGRSPALSRAVRDWFEHIVPPEAGALATAAARAREELRGAPRSPSAGSWSAALEHEIHARLIAALTPAGKPRASLDVV